MGSVEQLEVLLLLRDDAGIGWTAAAVNARLRSTQESIGRRLGLLAADGLVVRNGDEYHYEPGKHERVVAEVAACFKSRRVAVIETIFSGDDEAARTLADAFRIRRKP